MTLYVVYVPETGHVVGAVNALGGVPLDDDVEALVGSALPIRISIDREVVTLPLRANQLALLKADDEPEVYADPMAFGVEQVQGAEPKPTLVRLEQWDEDLVLTVDSLVITAPVRRTKAATVRALVSDGQDVHPCAGEMTAGEDSVELGVTVPIGKHAVLVLVAGLAGRLRVVARSS